MLVCGHGDVSEFCNKHNMNIVESYDGDIESYKGMCTILVTDQEMPEYEYYYLKGKLFSRGIELVSTKHKDGGRLSEYVVYAAQRELGQRQKFTGRHKFGYQNVNGEIVPHEGRMAVVKRILELRDKGLTLREIREDDKVRNVDGRMLSISTIQSIIKNRKDYES